MANELEVWVWVALVALVLGLVCCVAGFFKIRRWLDEREAMFMEEMMNNRTINPHLQHSNKNPDPRSSHDGPSRVQKLGPNANDSRWERMVSALGMRDTHMLADTIDADIRESEQVKPRNTANLGHNADKTDNIQNIYDNTKYPNRNYNNDNNDLDVVDHEAGQPEKSADDRDTQILENAYRNSMMNLDLSRILNSKDKTVNKKKLPPKRKAYDGPRLPHAETIKLAKTLERQESRSEAKKQQDMTSIYYNYNINQKQNGSNNDINKEHQARVEALRNKIKSAKDAIQNKKWNAYVPATTTTSNNNYHNSTSTNEQRSLSVMYPKSDSVKQNVVVDRSALNDNKNQIPTTTRKNNAVDRKANLPSIDVLRNKIRNTEKNNNKQTEKVVTHMAAGRRVVNTQAEYTRAQSAKPAQVKKNKAVVDFDGIERAKNKREQATNAQAQLQDRLDAQQAQLQPWARVNVNSNRFELDVKEIQNPLVISIRNASKLSVYPPCARIRINQA